jgi:GMP synthase-like glutamine amidotransferase
VSTADPQRIAAGPWFSWDDNMVRIPPGAELLAENENGPQAYGTAHHLGVQFHPEVTPGIIADWVQQDAKHALDTQQILEATSHEFATAAHAAHLLFTTFTSAAQRVHP